MKRCPICNAIAFDDAQTCYGCLHRFGEDDEGRVAMAGDAMPAPVETPASSGAAAPPPFLITLSPQRNEAGDTAWTCRVDLVPA